MTIALTLKESLADPKVELTIANSLWAAGDVKGTYDEVCKEVFLSDVYPLVAGSAGQINSWVMERTKGKIPKLLDQDPLGPAVLLNAVYFKGAWGSKFDEKMTKSGSFQTLDGTSLPCHYMQKSDKRMLFGETNTAQYVMLPYGEGKRVAAFAVLPNAAGKSGLMATVDELFGSDTSWDAAVSVDRLGPRNVKLELPRFKVEYGVKSLKSQLSEMGMKEAFLPQAAFDRMTSSPAYVDDVLHKAVIEVNEEGTVAAGGILKSQLPIACVRRSMKCICNIKGTRIMKNVILKSQLPF